MNSRKCQNYTFPFYANNDYLGSVVDQWMGESKVALDVFKDENGLLRQVHLNRPEVVILGVDMPFLSSGIVGRLAAIENRPIIVSVVENSNEQLLTECYAQGADRVLAIPACSSSIFQALLGVLVKKENNYMPYQINLETNTINFCRQEVRLTKKTFDVAQYLFANNGTLIPKARILKDLWGLDSAQCLTRRIEVHICRVRIQLALDGSYGWEIRAQKNRGYGIYKRNNTNDICVASDTA